MMNTPLGYATMEEFREAMKTEFTSRTPAPEAPEPPNPVRPMIVRVGQAAYAWVDVNDPSYQGSTASAQLRFFIVERSGNEVKQIDGKLDLVELDAMIKQLEQAKQTLRDKIDYLQAEILHEAAERTWKNQLDQYVRQRETEWQKTSQKKG